MREVVFSPRCFYHSVWQKNPLRKQHPLSKYLSCMCLKWFAGERSQHRLLSTSISHLFCALYYFLLHISCIIYPFSSYCHAFVSNYEKSPHVIFSAALMIIKLSRPVCVSLRLKCTELSWRVATSKAEENRIKQRGEWSRKEKRCFISGAAEAWGAEVNVDFYTWRENGEQLWLSDVLTASRDTWITHTVHTMSAVMRVHTRLYCAAAGSCF